MEVLLLLALGMPSGAAAAVVVVVGSAPPYMSSDSLVVDRPASATFRSESDLGSSLSSGTPVPVNAAPPTNPELSSLFCVLLPLLNRVLNHDLTLESPFGGDAGVSITFVGVERAPSCSAGTGVASPSATVSSLESTNGSSSLLCGLVTWSCTVSPSGSATIGTSVAVPGLEPTPSIAVPAAVVPMVPPAMAPPSLAPFVSFDFLFSSFSASFWALSFSFSAAASERAFSFSAFSACFLTAASCLSLSFSASAACFCTAASAFAFSFAARSASFCTRFSSAFRAFSSALS